MRPAHSAPVSCAAASPDGLSFASGSYDRRVLIWRAGAAGAERELCGHAGLVNGIDWAPDATLLASASSDRTARVWDAASGRELAVLRGHSDDVNSVRFSPDGRRLATASFDGSVRVWTREGACLLVAGHHRSDVNSVAWLPDGRRLAAASDDGTVSVFDAADGRPRRVLVGHTDWVDQVAPHPDGTRLASASQDGTVRVWDWVRGESLQTLDASTCVVKGVAWTPDGAALAASSYDGAVRVYRSEGGRLLLRELLRAEGLWNRTLAWTPEGWLTGSFGGGPVLLSRNGARRFGSRSTPGLNALAISPDGRSALVASDDGSLYEIDLASRRATGVLGRHEAAALSVVFSPDGRHAASGSWDRTVRVWERRSRKCVAEWQGAGDPINALAFDADGERLWIGTFNGPVVEFAWRRGRATVAGSHHGSVKSIASARGSTVSAGRDGTVRRWSGRGRDCFEAGASILNGVAIAPDGGRIATVSRRRGVEIWSPEGERLAEFRGHPCSAKAVAWSPDGSLVAAVYYDGHLALFDPATRMARVERICDASLSQVAFSREGILVSAWDAHGTLLVVDPASGDTEAIRAAA
jgi:WD40 repeat protein